MTGTNEPIPTATPSARATSVGGPLWAKVFIAFGATLVLLSTGTIAAIEGLAHRYEAAVQRGDLIAPEARQSTVPEQTSSITGPLNFLLIGSDYRAGRPGDGQRADTIIIAHVSRTLDRAYLISIPRDLLVRIPAFPASSYPGGQGKINGAFQFGGPGKGAQLLSATLSQLTGVAFNGAAIVDFEGFRTAVDVLGGVYLCVDTRVASNHLGVDRDGRILQLWADESGRIQGVPPGGRPYVFEEGCHRMNGMVALDYARLRYGLPAGDYDRQRNQQKFLKALFQEATRAGLVGNPIKFDEFVRAVGSSLTVDTGELDLADLIFGLRNVTPSRLVGVKVPSEPRIINGVSYVVALAEAESLYQAIHEDTLEEWVAAHPTWAEQL